MIAPTDKSINSAVLSVDVIQCLRGAIKHLETHGEVPTARAVDDAVQLTRAAARRLDIMRRDAHSRQALDRQNDRTEWVDAGKDLRRKKRKLSTKTVRSRG